MATNYLKSGGEFGGKSGKTMTMTMKMKLKSLKRRDDDMSFNNVEEDHYHTGAAASVPFMWESEPGTPKKLNFEHNGDFFSPDNHLTPPPSSYSSPSQTPPPLRHINSKSASSRTNFLNSVFRKLSKKASLQPPSPAGSSSSSSSSSSTRERGRVSFDSRVDEDDEYQEDQENNVESPVSTLFFGRGVAGATDKGCYPKFIKVFARDFK